MKKKKDPDLWIILLLLLISSAISWNLYFKNYSQKDTVNIADFPTTIEGWVAKDLPLTDVEYDILETKNVFVRKYSKAKHGDVYLFIVYSQNNRKVSHPPEVCYTGAGIAVLSNTLDAIPAVEGKEEIKVNKLLLDSRGMKQSAFYWFKVGDTFTSNYWRQQMLIAVKTILSRPSSSALIRISTDVVDQNVEAADQELKAFGNLITPQLYQSLP